MISDRRCTLGGHYSRVQAGRGSRPHRIAYRKGQNFGATHGLNTSSVEDTVAAFKEVTGGLGPTLVIDSEFRPQIVHPRPPIWVQTMCIDDKQRSNRPRPSRRSRPELISHSRHSGHDRRQHGSQLLSDLPNRPQHDER